MNVFSSVRLSAIFRWTLALALLIGPQIARAAGWHAAMGAQSKDQAQQALAFLPNELWIHAGDSVTWTANTPEIHTVTFLTPGQVRPPFPVGCPGFSPDGSATFDGSTCVSTPPMVTGQTFTVTFPVAGNFKLVCLVHENMTGIVHVLPGSQALPHDQAFYDSQAVAQRNALLADDDAPASHHHAHGRSMTVGIGEVVANGGGFQTLSIMRFSEPNMVIHVGQTVEWTNFDAVTPHTITFGVEPVDPIPPVNVTLDADGARHGIINSSADNVHSGFIGAAPQEQLFLPQPPPGVTRFRVTFTHAGVFPYICALHDTLGMKGKVTVLP